MPGRMFLLLALSFGVLGGAATLAPIERAIPVQGECAGKKRVIAGTVRNKRIETRRRCHVFMPILM
ncbi:hypothetical protein [Blastomonas sp.]|uniref:hypothetical protein n=1 Tax=Blastomonas sp. TaxID=1909299 RepID=UPI00262BE135|nr:hypothetical protein [Blastomonas sp.]MDM7956745.1 hypothetical protein [Blastomonas sp.]